MVLTTQRPNEVFWLEFLWKAAWIVHAWTPHSEGSDCPEKDLIPATVDLHVFVSHPLFVLRSSNCLKT